MNYITFINSNGYQIVFNLWEANRQYIDIQIIDSFTSSTLYYGSVKGFKLDAAQELIKKSARSRFY